METQRFTRFTINQYIWHGKMLSGGNPKNRFKSCVMELRFFGKKAGESNWKWASRT